MVEELLGHDGWVTTAAFAPDERTILTANQDGTARIWDATAAEPREQFRTGLPSAYASFASDGESVLTTGPAVVPILWNPETGSQDVAVSDSTLIATHAAPSPDGSLIATTSDAHFVGAELVDSYLAQVWTAGDGLERTLRGHDATINSVAFSPDSEAIVTASDDGTARIWELSSGDSRTLEGPGRDVKSAAFSPDGTQVVTAGTDDKARVWDVAGGEQVAVLRGHSGSVYSAAFSPDGKLVVTGSGDNSARIWDLAVAGPGSSSRAMRTPWWRRASARMDASSSPRASTAPRASGMPSPGTSCSSTGPATRSSADRRAPIVACFAPRPRWASIPRISE